MTSKKLDHIRNATQKRILRIKEQIVEMDYVSSGTLVTRTKVCGKTGCRCAHDRAARHGPYHEWGYMKDGRQAHRMLSNEQTAFLKKAIANYRAVLRLLRAWERQTVRILDSEKKRKP